eukprot:scaffold452144_cov40-Prasinocladus_malaysianus.AAC.1
MQRLEVLPIDIIKYIAWIGMRGFVAADNMQPYLSSIDKFMQGHGKSHVALARVLYSSACSCGPKDAIKQNEKISPAIGFEPRRRSTTAEKPWSPSKWPTASFFSRGETFNELTRISRQIDKRPGGHLAAYRPVSKGVRATKQIRAHVATYDVDRRVVAVARALSCPGF